MPHCFYGNWDIVVIMEALYLQVFTRKSVLYFDLPRIYDNFYVLTLLLCASTTILAFRKNMLQLSRSKKKI